MFVPSISRLETSSLTNVCSCLKWFWSREALGKASEMAVPLRYKPSRRVAAKQVVHGVIERQLSRRAGRRGEVELDGEQGRRRVHTPVRRRGDPLRCRVGRQRTHPRRVGGDYVGAVAGDRGVELDGRERGRERSVILEAQKRDLAVLAANRPVTAVETDAAGAGDAAEKAHNRAGENARSQRS